MLRLGAPLSETRAMDLNDLFNARVKLMIVMAEAYLNRLPLGPNSRRAMLKNARIVEAECIDQGNFAFLPATVTQSPYSEVPKDVGHDECFFRQVKLIAVMVKAVSQGFRLGEDRKKEMREHLALICQAMKFDNVAEYLKFLKVT